MFSKFNQWVLSKVYKKYVGTFSLQSRNASENLSNEMISHDLGNSNFFEGKSDKDVDDFATQVGNTYRGAGVLIGILGASIIFCAIAPTAFSIESEGWLIFFGILKVAMMLLMAGIVFIGQRMHLKEHWIGARREAERRRYERLEKSMKDLNTAPTQANAQELFTEVLYCLVDKNNGQVGYNLSKARTYKAIEDLSRSITWWGFILALLAALYLLASEFHFVQHRPIMIIFTAFGPAAIGCIHGINGFLNISGLADEHKEMAKYLEGIHQELLMTQNRNLHTDPETMRSLAERAFSQLMDRDVQWATSVAKAELKPA